MKVLKYVSVLACLAVAMPVAAELKVLDESMEQVSGPPEQCVRLSSIDHTDVLDDQNILFYMRGKDVYLNHLPYPCSGLRVNDTFMYRTSLNQLCNVDIITVLDNIGFGFSPRNSCGLGLFYPVSKENVKLLKENAKAKRKG